MPLQLLNASSHALQPGTYKAKQTEPSLRDARHVWNWRGVLYPVFTSFGKPPLWVPVECSAAAAGFGTEVRAKWHARHYRYPHKHACYSARHCCPCAARQGACPLRSDHMPYLQGFVL